MATVLDSLSIPRVTAFSSPISSSLILTSSVTCLNLPEFRGLKLAASNRSLGSVSYRSRIVRRRCSRVVAESSETAVKVPTVTEDTWKSLVLESDIPVLVEFWAPWCGPCRMIQPIVDELSVEYDGKLKVFKVNTDDCPKVASEYGVRSIPTVIIFKNGEKKEAVIGAVPKTTLKTSIEKFLLP